MTLLEACKAYIENPESEDARGAVFGVVMNTSVDDSAWNHQSMRTTSVLSTSGITVADLAESFAMPCMEEAN